MRRDTALWAMLDGRASLPLAARTLGWRLDAHNETDRSVSVSFAAGAALADALGGLPAGLLAAMLDECMRPAICAELAPGRIVVNVESNAVFLRPARPGRLFGYGRIEQWHGGRCVVRARLSDAAGRVVATASATYRIADLRKRRCKPVRPRLRQLLLRKLRRRTAAKLSHRR